MFSGVGKTDDELAAGLDAGDRRVQRGERGRGAASLGHRVARGVLARVTLRVNPDIDPRSHPYISTGLRENKFGVDIA